MQIFVGNGGMDEHTHCKLKVTRDGEDVREQSGKQKSLDVQYTKNLSLHLSHIKEMQMTKFGW